MRSIAFFFASMAVWLAQAACAQDVPARVGRLALTQGSVSVYQDPDLGWDKAYVNTPVTSENSIWTDRGARAEMRVGGTSVRLDGETQLDVSRLDDNDLDANVPRGTLNVRVRYKERADHLTFSTPHALFSLETDGRYRIDVDEDRDQSRLTVFGGSANMEGPSGRIAVEAGRTVVISGGQYAFERAREDAFDRWATTRDQLWQDSNARRYVSDDMTGYEELDRYGSWAQDADYGAMWYPSRVSSGWAPYRNGHWSYVRPWGYTWIDDEPWGYAPSHYGRWVLVGNRWGWTPGAVRERPVWAPALVGFIGGAGFSVGISTGAPIGWYPLAPWERYQPWWRSSPTYVTSVNRYVVDRRPRWYQGRGDEWRSWNRERAATVVNRDVFVNRRPVQNSVVRVNADAIRRAQVISSPQAVQQALPQRNELLRYREANRENVAAPTLSRRREGNAQAQPQQQAQQQAQPGGTQVVRPDFRRRGSPPVVAPAPAGQPAASAPAQQAQPQRQPENPAARGREQQRPSEDAARAAQQQQQQARDAQRQQQEQAQRGAREAQQQQQEQAQRAAREAQQQQQQQADVQRKREEAAQRAAADTRQREEQLKRQQQEQAQRGAQQQQQQQQQAQERAQREAARQQQDAQRAQQQQQQQAQERAQRAQQQDAQRAQQQQQQQQQAQERAQRAQQQEAQRAQQQQARQQQEAAQRAQQQQQQQQQAQERAQRAQPQPQPQPQQQANPSSRGEERGRGRGRDDKEDKDKEKDKR